MLKKHSKNSQQLPTSTEFDPIISLLLVEVIEAKDLPKLDKFGLSDPYVVLRFGVDIKLKTKVIKKNLNPEWNEVFKILVLRSQEKYNINFDVYDWDRNSKDDFAGTASVDLSTILHGLNDSNHTKTQDLWLKLDNEDKHGKELGSIHVRITAKDRQSTEREFWALFAEHFDADKTSTINFLEFCAMAEAIGCTVDNDELASLFSRADSDNNGVLSIDEFVTCLCTDAQSKQQNAILAQIWPEGTTDFVWHVLANMNSENSVGDIILERGFYGKVERKKQPGEKDKIIVQDRKTGKLVDEKIPEYIRVSMRMMYATGTGRFAVNKMQIHRVLKHLSEQQGKKFNRSSSVKEIENFIEYHELNRDEIADPLDSFRNFNEFFYRKLKAGVRPVASPDSNVAVSPADCRLNVFPSVDDATNLWIKGKNFTIANLLQDSVQAKTYEGGTVVIARLAPQDYHRFHIPVDGVLGSFIPLNGSYYTVNPIAIKQNVDVYTENKRITVEIDSPQFGKVCYVAIGATMVGSIVFTAKEGQTVKRGDELGYFAFGGSTIIVLFRKGSINLDEDLVANSAKPIETLIMMGNSIGKANT